MRIARVRALNDHDLLAVVTYMLARHPDTFPAMLDDALSSLSPSGLSGLGPGLVRFELIERTFVLFDYMF